MPLLLLCVVLQALSFSQGKMVLMYGCVGRLGLSCEELVFNGDIIFYIRTFCFLTYSNMPFKKYIKLMILE